MEGAAVEGVNGVGKTDSKGGDVEGGIGVAVPFVDGMSVDAGTNTTLHSSSAVLNCIYRSQRQSNQYTSVRLLCREEQPGAYDEQEENQREYPMPPPHAGRRWNKQNSDNARA